MLGHNNAVSHQNMATLCFDIVPTMWPNVCNSTIPMSHSLVSESWTEMLNLIRISGIEVTCMGVVEGFWFLPAVCGCLFSLLSTLLPLMRMIGGELGACPGQVVCRASVPGKDHLCRRVYFGTAAGHSRACLRQGVDRSKTNELSCSWTSLWFRFYHCFCGYMYCGVDVMCVKHHCAANSRNFFDVNCGPSSNQNTCTAE